MENKESNKIELEKENFKVDSCGWEQFSNEQGILYLENSEKDIWEYVDGVPAELIGQQLFTQGAAIRETQKVGKRMPTDKEFDQFGKKDFNEVIYVGNRSTDQSFRNLREYAYCWSRSMDAQFAWARGITHEGKNVCRHAYDQDYGFFVRCLKG